MYTRQQPEWCSLHVAGWLAGWLASLTWRFNGIKWTVEVLLLCDSICWGRHFQLHITFRPLNRVGWEFVASGIVVSKLQITAVVVSSSGIEISFFGHNAARDPSVSKANWLWISGIFQFFFITLRNIVYIALNGSVIFFKSWFWAGYFVNLTGSFVNRSQFFPSIDRNFRDRSKWRVSRSSSRDHIDPPNYGSNWTHNPYKYMNLGQSTRDIEKLSYVRQWNIFDSLTMTNLHISFHRCRTIA